MADSDIENPFGFVDRRDTQGAANQPGNLASFRYTAVALLRQELAARSGYYTTARLNEMTKNDMIFALRTFDDAAGF